MGMKYPLECCDDVSFRCRYDPAPFEGLRQPGGEDLEFVDGHRGSWSAVEKVHQRRSRIVQILNVPNENLGGRKHWRGFSVRQDPSQARTAYTECSLYLLGLSLAPALLDSLFEQPTGPTRIF